MDALKDFVKDLKDRLKSDAGVNLPGFFGDSVT